MCRWTSRFCAGNSATTHDKEGHHQQYPKDGAALHDTIEHPDLLLLCAAASHIDSLRFPPQKSYQQANGQKILLRFGQRQFGEMPALIAQIGDVDTLHAKQDRQFAAVMQVVIQNAPDRPLARY